MADLLKNVNGKIRGALYSAEAMSRYVTQAELEIVVELLNAKALEDTTLELLSRTRWWPDADKNVRTRILQEMIARAAAAPAPAPATESSAAAPAPAAPESSAAAPAPAAPESSAESE